MPKLVVRTDDKGIIIGYALVMNDDHQPIDGVHVDTDLDIEKVELVGNYKLLGDILVPLTEDEKPEEVEELSEIEILTRRVDEQQAIIDVLMLEVIPNLLPTIEEVK